MNSAVMWPHAWNGNEPPLRSLYTRPPRSATYSPGPSFGRRTSSTGGYSSGHHTELEYSPIAARTSCTYRWRIAYHSFSTMRTSNVASVSSPMTVV
jgi:hypothetical protein